LQTKAQTWLNDYTSYYSESTNLYNSAIYRDDPGNVYYIAQVTPTNHSKIIITKADQDYNNLSTTSYQATTTTAYFSVSGINEVTSLHELVVVGNYIDEGTSSGGYIMAIDKLTGIMLWFKTFPNITGFNSCTTYNTSASSGGIIIAGKRQGTGHIYSITGQSGVLMSVNAQTAAVNWTKEFESGKYIGNNIGATGIYNTLLSVTKINNNKFAATGFFNRIGFYSNDVWDGDGALIVFDASGTTFTESALGRATPLQHDGSVIERFQEGESITYDAADNTVVIAGNVLQFSTGFIGPICPIASPRGTWATKIDLSTYTTTWSNIYDATSNPNEGISYNTAYPVKIVSDGNGNYGFAFYKGFDLAHFSSPGYKGDQVVAKIEPIAGNIVYSRDLTNPANDGVVYDICKGLSSYDIMAVGNLTTTPIVTGWNIEAFDHVINYCQEVDYPLNPIPNSYQIFAVADQLFAPTTGTFQFTNPGEKIGKDDICPKSLFSPKTASVAYVNTKVSVAVNPTVVYNDNVTCEITGVQPTDAEIIVCNAVGSVLYKKMVAVHAGKNNYQVDRSVFNSGLNIVRVIQNNAVINTTKIVVAE
jgi:hypothetical protein